MDQPDPRRPVGVTIFMVVVGIILLLPGICAVVFLAGMGADSTFMLLWAVCFLIALGGVWLLIRAFR